MNCFLHLLYMQILNLHLLFVFLSLTKESEIVESAIDRIKKVNNIKHNKESHTICLYFRSSVQSNCLFAGPNSTPLTLLAKFREQIVSLKSFSLGLICTNMSVFESPPRKTKFVDQISIVIFAYMQI